MILTYLKSVYTHPTAETVYTEVRKKIPTISRGTVYRNLNRLSEEGKVLKLEIGRESHFDGDCCNHQHFICESCGGIFDIHQPELSNHACKKAESAGLHPRCVRIIFKGRCNNCEVNE